MSISRCFYQHVLLNAEKENFQIRFHAKTTMTRVGSNHYEQYFLFFSSFPCFESKKKSMREFERSVLFYFKIERCEESLALPNNEITCLISCLSSRLYVIITINGWLRQIERTRV